MRKSRSDLSNNILEEVVLQVSLHFGEDRSTETRDGVPTLGGDVTNRTAARLSAVVVAGGDISEGTLISGVHLVQQGVSETDGRLAVVQQEAVQERNDGSEDGGRGRSTATRKLVPTSQMDP